MKHVLQNFPFMNLMVVALFVFLSIFAAVVAWILLPQNQKKFERIAQMPLNDELTENV